MTTAAIISLLATFFGGMGGKSIFDWLLGRRKVKVDTLKTALESLAIAVDEIRDLRTDLARAHSQIEELKQEVANLRADLSARKESSS